MVLTQCDVEEPLISNSVRGLVEFGIHAHALPDGVGLPLILAVGSYLATYAYVLEYSLIDISFPESVLAGPAYPGPKVGPAFVSGSGTHRLGMVIKPRFVTDAAFLRQLVRDAADGGLDYITDDELTVGTASFPFERRLDVVRRALDEASASTGHRPAYIANITGETDSALRWAERAQELGADGVMVNVYSMGYDVVSRLASDSGFPLGIVANGLGLGTLTRGLFRVSTEVVAKLTRLAGADAFYTGPFAGLLDSAHHSALQFQRALTQPLSRSCRRRSAAAVMSGGVGLPEIVHNCTVYRGPIFISMGYHLAEYLLKGITSTLLIECIREVSSAMISGGSDEGQRTIERLARRGAKYRACLKAIRAEEAVSK